MTSAARTVAVIQCRMSSSRLPGKVLMPLAGQPAVLFMCQRVRQARLVDDLCVATSDDASDDPLAAAVEAAGINLHRGSLNDVLDRFVGAARRFQADIVIRLTGDCPLIDPALIDDVVRGLAAGGVDYVSNVDPPTFPDGLDVEAFTMAALERAAREARLVSEREHVTPYIRSDIAVRKMNIAGAADLSALRWTIDYPDDYEHVGRMIGSVRGDPVTADRFDYLRAHEEVAGAATTHARNEGLAQSLAADRTVN